MKAVAIVQARMSSSRLPGKVLLPIAGKPLLWHIVHRLRACGNLDGIVVATSTEPEDDSVAAFCAAEGVDLVRGPRDDVLERFRAAAERTGADIVVRICGDCPLVDPWLVDQIVATLRESGSDYCTGDPAVVAPLEGVEGFSRAALDRLVRDAKSDPVAREHVSGYFNAHPEFATRARVPLPASYAFAGARVSVDVPADLEFIEAVYGKLGSEPGEARVEDLVALLRREPELVRINAHVGRKPVGAAETTVLLRCDGDSEIGMGHVSRALALADALRDVHGCRVIFAMGRESRGSSVVRMASYAVEIRGGTDEHGWLTGLVEATAAGALILDSPVGPAVGTLRALRASGVVVAVIDDASERALAADLAFFPPVPQIAERDWTGFAGSLHVGWEWVILRREFADPPAARRASRPRVLLTFGGSDAAGLAGRALEAVQSLDADFDATILVGPAYPCRDELEQRIQAGARRVELQPPVAEVRPLFETADVAVTTFGVTAYELARLGVPSIVIPLTDMDSRSAGALVDAGAAVRLPRADEVKPADIAVALEELLGDSTRRAAMSAAGPRVLDGRGAFRVSAAVLEAVIRA